jgi:hypothetical protein
MLKPSNPSQTVEDDDEDERETDRQDKLSNCKSSMAVASSSSGSAKALSCLHASLLVPQTTQRTGNPRPCLALFPLSDSVAHTQIPQLDGSIHPSTVPSLADFVVRREMGVVQVARQLVISLLRCIMIVSWDSD